ncbi:hypothetical protein [Streptomonospora wellingtoniae]|uniref:Cysteine-rich CPCC domain-containing protein n=1 Tax=Streptomonospora wellingtoniae TaxID=3075544 RepID=A0ABU2KUF5_9ACTN|nr:hypothetical protein [Streptomonospora sp. DSM 45055]MDT0302926.1 hypothetical protein [Streptomonospora sp. DSM 45055]
MSEIGTYDITGLVTCALCDWRGHTRIGGASAAGLLTLHRMDAHRAEYLAAHPEAAPYLPEIEETTDE